MTIGNVILVVVREVVDSLFRSIEDHVLITTTTDAVLARLSVDDIVTARADKRVGSVCPVDDHLIALGRIKCGLFPVRLDLALGCQNPIMVPDIQCREWTDSALVGNWRVELG